MNKKLVSYITLLTVIVMQFAAFSVNAADDLTSTVEIVGDKMYVKGVLSSGKSDEVLLRVIKVDENFNIDEDTVYIEQKISDEKGKYEFEVLLEDEAPETLPDQLSDFTATRYSYSVGVFNGNSDFDSAEIEFFGENYQKFALNIINNSKEEEKPENIGDVLAQAYEKLYLAAEVYEEYMENPVNAEAVMLYVSNLPKAETLPMLKAQLNEAAAVTMLKDNKDNAEKLNEIIAEEKYREILGINKTTALQSYEDFETLCGDEMVKSYASAEINTAEESKKAFEFAVISSALKECITAAQTTKLLKTNEKLLSIDVDGYDLKEEELLEIAGMELKKDLSEIKEKIVDVIADRKKPSGSSGSSSKGGSSKGSGNSTIALVSPSASVKNEVQNTEVKEFSDLDGYDWAKESIKVLRDKKIINGRTNETFDPSARVTREEFLKMLLCALGINGEALDSQQFTDVVQGAWYSEYVYAALKRGIVNGTSTNIFGIGEAIKREDAAVIAYRVLLNLDLLNESIEYECAFTDADKISEYAYNAVAYMENNEIISGYEDGSFNATGTITRAEAAVLVKKILDFSNRIL